MMIRDLLTTYQRVRGAFRLLNEDLIYDAERVQ